MGSDICSPSRCQLDATGERLPALAPAPECFLTFGYLLEESDAQRENQDCGEDERGGGRLFPSVGLGIQGGFVFILLPQNSAANSRSDQGIAQRLLLRGEGTNSTVPFSLELFPLLALNPD